MRRLLFASLVVLAFPLLGNGEWGRGGCAAPGMVIPHVPLTPLLLAQPVPAPLRWIRYPDNPGQAFLMQGGTCVGGWDHDTRAYRAWDGRGWGAEQRNAPIAPPADPRDTGTLPPAKAASAPPPAKLEAWQTNGVPLNHTRPPEAGESHKIGGVEVPPNAAFDRLGDNKLADDSGKLYVVVRFDDPALRAKFAADYATDPGLAELRSHAHLWAGDAAAPTHVTAIDRDGKQINAQGISLLTASGQELWHEATYTPETLGRLQKADPGYSPDKSPGPHRDEESGFGLLLLAGGVLLALIFGRPATLPPAAADPREQPW